MRIKILSIALLCFSPFLSFSQEYKHLFRASYPLGTEYTKRGGLLDNVELGKPSSRAKTKVDVKAFKESNDYFIDRFLNSGKVIAYSEANVYLNKVVDKLLYNDQALRDKVKFYFVNTSEVNAFTFTNGMIFVNIGLLARLENEAQLAFVLSHEIAHFKEKHSFERYKFQTETEVKEMSDEEFYEVVLSKFSKNQEFEADKIGFEIFKNSGYYLDESVQTFEILKLAEYPVENVRIEKYAFESAFLKIPTHYYPDTSYGVVFNENDTSLTHPSSVKRQDELRKQIAATRASASGKFLVSEQTFYELKLAAQFALSDIYINEKDYLSSLYNTERLLLKYPGNEMLLEKKVQALYYYVSNVNAGAKSSVVRKPQKIYGELKKFHFLFKNLTKKEANTVALRLAWDIYLAFPKNIVVKEFTNRITKQFIYAVTNNLKFFEAKSAYNQNYIDSIYQTQHQATIQSKGSYPKSKSSSSAIIRKSTSQVKDALVKYAIPDLLENPEFMSTFEALTKELAEDKKADPNNLQEEESGEETAEAKAPKKSKKSKVPQKKQDLAKESIDLKKLLVIDVSNINLDLTAKTPVRFFAIKNKQKELVNTIQYCAKLNGIELIVFNPIDLIENDTQFFNDRSTLELWRTECISNGLNEMLPHNYNEISEICQRYGTKYVTFINTQSIIMPINQSQLFLNMLYTAYNPPLFIVAMTAIFRYERYSAIQMPIYDIMTGKLMVDFSNVYDVPDHSDFMRAEFYYFFNTLKK